MGIMSKQYMKEFLVLLIIFFQWYLLKYEMQDEVSKKRKLLNFHQDFSTRFFKFLRKQILM